MSAEPSLCAPDIVGQAGSPRAMRRLQDAIADLRALSVEPYLRQSVAALQAEQAQEAAQWAIKALERDERCGMAWYCPVSYTHLPVPRSVNAVFTLVISVVRVAT